MWHNQYKPVQRAHWSHVYSFDFWIAYCSTVHCRLQLNCKFNKQQTTNCLALNIVLSICLQYWLLNRFWLVAGSYQQRTRITVSQKQRTSLWDAGYSTVKIGVQGEWTKKIAKQSIISDQFWATMIQHVFIHQLWYTLPSHFYFVYFVFVWCKASLST